MVRDSHRVSVEALSKFVTDVFVALGLPEEDARISAAILVASDVRGIDTHGVARLFYYVWRLRQHLINPTPHITIVRQTACSALVDGDNGMGTVVGTFSMKKALELADRSGVGLVTVTRSNHYGIAGYYSMMALEKDMIGISLTNANCLVLPTYGRSAGFGTNPISVAVPTGKEKPWVLDMATSAVSMGKVEEALRADGHLAPGLATDSEGNDTTDPSKVLGMGFLYPLGGTASHGGHKGYGLGVLVDILSAVLSGADFGIHQEGLTSLGTRPANVGHFFGALRISDFMAVDEFKQRMDRMIADLKGLPKAHDRDRIYVHGELEYECEQDRMRNGIPLNPHVVSFLKNIAEETGVAFDCQ